MNILHIDSSILGDNSASRKLGAAVIEKLTATNPQANVTYYDLVANPIPYLTGGLYAAQGKAPADRTAAEQQDVLVSDVTMQDFQDADVLVIAAPMYNFGVPAQLKSWIDRVAVAGKTFRYTANGPEGLVQGKRVIIISSRGNFYGPGATYAVMDHQEKYLISALGFLGITDIEIIRAEGLAISPENAAKANAKAMHDISVLA